MFSKIKENIILRNYILYINKDYTEIKYLQLLLDYLHNYLFSKNREKYKTITDEGEKKRKRQKNKERKERKNGKDRE